MNDSYRIEFRASVLFSVEASSPEEAKERATKLFNAHNSGEYGDIGWDIDVDDKYSLLAGPSGRVYLDDESGNNPAIVDIIALCELLVSKRGVTEISYAEAMSDADVIEEALGGNI